LIQWTHEWKLRTWPSYKAFIDLLDNYNPYNNELEPDYTAEELGEIKSYLNLLTEHRPVITVVKDFLLSKSKLVIFIAL
jgi:hypothetical protein